ncbi:hypothetical protein Nepgr_033441 [Nepenthes gracilis]|uniref:UspA domain-containing protein n=1 Tax=Nepenthes gracilis TaxID=150966 RepID=A0AAD3TLF7_NEPGR|nr:hypothetical protein Nepgr_033441 [Nepenthes gracilis]
MEERKIVVVVEEGEAARTAMEWSLRNLLRYGDVIILLHVFPRIASRSRKRLRRLRLEGFQLALSFKDICANYVFNTKIETIVTEDDEDGRRIVAVVREIGAFALVAGLHHRSFLYRLAVTHGSITDVFNCRVLAVKQPPPASAALPAESSSAGPFVDFSQIDLAPLRVPHIEPQKIPYRICPSPYAIIWRSKKKSKNSKR